MSKTANRLLTGAAIALMLTAPLSAKDLRPQDMSTDEAGMWYQVDKLEQHVKTAGIRNTDPALIDYVTRVTCKVTGEDCNQIRVYIIDAPVFNAGMYPNGMMMVNSGLLLRAENEAQLACVIGHEYGHFSERHSLERWRKAKGLANLSMVVSMAAGAAGAGNGGSLASGLVSLALQQSFSREHEREADDIGFAVTAGAGYSATECALVWTNLISEQDASEFKKVRKRGRRNNIFSSHPVPKARAATLAAMAVSTPSGADLGEAVHKAATQRHFSHWLKTELLAKDYSRHIHLFEQLKARGRDGAVLDYYIGEAYRLRRGEGDREKAIAAWESAAQQIGAPAEVWRALGEHYRKKKRRAEALSAYQKYLNQAPAAQDRELIAAYVNRLSSE
ncbi:MAG: M48 family metalloprotease [Robiginitomaculum sp.]